MAPEARPPTRRRYLVSRRPNPGAGRLLLLCGALVLGGCRGARHEPAPEAVNAPPGPLHFTDITARAGIKFQHNNGACGLKLMPETMSGGAAFLDYDGDGYPDVFLVNGRDWTATEIGQYQRGPWASAEIKEFEQRPAVKYRPGMLRPIPAHRSRGRTTGALYHNNGNLTFTDVTSGSGLDIEMQGMGVAAGDYDNDGKPDLYVTGLGRNYLFHNQSVAGHAHFREVAGAAGVRDAGWSTGAMWLDYDKDGLLDLFVCHYVKWSPATDTVVYHAMPGMGKSYTGPQDRHGEANRLYHNVGHGRFEDVSLQSGIVRALQPARGTGMPTSPSTYQEKTADYRNHIGHSLGVALCDMNKDGWPDILVTNDTRPNFLFLNHPHGTFTEAAVPGGLAYSATGQSRAGMGVDIADIDHSDLDSVVIGNFSYEKLGLYRNQGNGTFLDIAAAGEAGRASVNFLTFGVVFADFDNDGWPDILAVNGHVRDDINREQAITYRQRSLLFHNQRQSQFREVALQCGEALGRPLVARGLACADIDLDGAVDVLITTNGGTPLLLRNETIPCGNSIRVVLQGTRSDRSGIGAVARARLKDTGLRRTAHSGSSYLSQSELPITLGLGEATQAALLSVRWPSGRVTQLRDVAANQMLTIDEDRGLLRRQPLPGRIEAPP